MKKFLLSIIFIFWNVALNPVSVISVISVTANNNTVKCIRAELGIPYGMSDTQIDSSKYLNSSDTLQNLKQLGHMLNNEWNYAMNDMTAQSLILIVAVILALYQFLNGLFPLAPYAFKKNSTGIGINSEIRSDIWTILFVTISVIMFAFVAWVYFGNESANLSTLKLYLPPGGKITGKTHWPPSKSLITICRYFVGIYGFISSIYFQYHFNTILSKLKN